MSSRVRTPPKFAVRPPGKEVPMIGLAVALVVIGVIFLFVIPWVGIPVGIVGLVLLVLWLLGMGKRTAATEHRP